MAARRGIYPDPEELALLKKGGYILMPEPKPGDANYYVDVSDRPLPPGTPVNSDGLPIFVMTDPGDLNWPRSMNPADPNDPTKPLYGDDEP